MLSLNVGNLDRAIRIILGVTLLALASNRVIGVWGYVGVVPLLTGVGAYCPLYAMLGIATTSR